MSKRAVRCRQGVIVIKAGVDQLGLGIGSLATAGFGAYSLKRVLDTPYDPEVNRCKSTIILCSPYMLVRAACASWGRSA